MIKIDTFIERLDHAKVTRQAELGIEKPIYDNEIAAKAGISPSAISQWRNSINTDKIKAAHVFSVARFLNVRPEWLWDKKGPMKGQGDELPQEMRELYADLKKAAALGLGPLVAAPLHEMLRTLLRMHQAPIDLNRDASKGE